jgi:hypothetical protein
MPRKSVTELELQADTTLEDNVTKNISAADVRTLIKDFLNAFRPAYGTLTLTGAPVINLGLTPVKAQWNNAQDSDINQTSSSAATGRITRTDRGTSEITFTMDFECTQGRLVSFTLYKNGAATPWRVTATGAGSGKPVGVAFSAIDYADPAAYYEIFAECDTASTATTMSNGSCVLKVAPVNSYT